MDKPRIYRSDKSAQMNSVEILFHKLNQQYFDGRLPEYRIVLSESLDPRCGECDKEKREICVSAALSEDELTKLLLHEMVHAAVPENGHNAVWLAEMERLANMGAPTREDWEAYRDPKRTITNKDIEAEAFDMGMLSSSSWSEARLGIGIRYGLTEKRGRSKSSRAKKFMQKLRTQFYKGRSV